MVWSWLKWLKRDQRISEQDQPTWSRRPVAPCSMRPTLQQWRKRSFLAKNEGNGHFSNSSDCHNCWLIDRTRALVFWDFLVFLILGWICKNNLETAVPVPAFRFSSTTLLQLVVGKRWGAVGKDDPESRVQDWRMTVKQMTCQHQDWRLNGATCWPVQGLAGFVQLIGEEWLGIRGTPLGLFWKFDDDEDAWWPWMFWIVLKEEDL